MYFEKRKKILSPPTRQIRTLRTLPLRNDYSLVSRTIHLLNFLLSLPVENLTLIFFFQNFSACHAIGQANLDFSEVVLNEGHEHTSL